MRFDLFPDEQYEREMRKVYGLFSSEDREVNPSGAYTPVKGIYSLGWDAWKERPSAGFVSSLIEWHNGFARDHSSEPFFPAFAPLIQRGELTTEELREQSMSTMSLTSQVFSFEGLAHARAHMMGAREIRDIIARHLFEETGHNEMFADFMVGAFGMDRMRDVYPLTDPANFSRPLLEFYGQVKRLSASGELVEVAAGSMLMERFLPRAYRMMIEGLRKHYGVKESALVFHNVHCYIDIYHERFGQYILAKYATSKEKQTAAEKAFKDTILGQYRSWKALYESFPIHRR